jgi:hypothetical protein
MLVPADHLETGAESSRPPRADPRSSRCASLRPSFFPLGYAVDAQWPAVSLGTWQVVPPLRSQPTVGTPTVVFPKTSWTSDAPGCPGHDGITRQLCEYVQRKTNWPILDAPWVRAEARRATARTGRTLAGRSSGTLGTPATTTADPHPVPDSVPFVLTRWAPMLRVTVLHPGRDLCSSNPGVLPTFLL